MKSLLFMVYSKSVNCYCTDRAARAEEFAGAAADAYFFRNGRNLSAVFRIIDHTDGTYRTACAAVSAGFLTQSGDAEVEVDRGASDMGGRFLLAGYRQDSA